jgi:hypothetical protein
MSVDSRPNARHVRPSFPGVYERSTPPHREPGSVGVSPSVALATDSSVMDAATIAEREREGGGAPGQRRRAVPGPAPTRPVLSAMPSDGSRLTGGYRWLQLLRLAGR